MTEFLAPHQAPEPPRAPLVSIVVCFYNNVELTRRCLQHVRRNSPRDIYEIVLVDDCSDDHRASELASLPDVRFVRTEQNRGFTFAANLGAGLARGKYLLFLNNDTEVQPGWLEAMLDAAVDGPDVGAVGGRLVYPDGRLQEAGGIIFSDATGLNAGKGRDPSDPAFTFRREVDYCSGACLLVARDLFETFGRFDESFAPGYYEDTDLCFWIRQAGKVVLYEPGARVVHHEGATFGNDWVEGISTGHDKAALHLNRYRFHAKWAEALLRQYPPGTAGGYRGGHIPDRPRVLVCDGTVPTPDRDSGSLRMTWILRLLHEVGCEVTLFPLDRTERQPYADWLRRVGIEVHCTPDGLDHLGQERPDLYDLVLITRPSIASTLRGATRRWFPRALLVYDAVDLHFVREGRRLALERASDREVHDYRRERRAEVDEIRAADVVSAVTDAEREIIEELTPGTPTILLPNVHEDRDDPVPGQAARTGQLFIGDFRHPPNVDAVAWFASEIVPHLGSIESSTLTVIGELPLGVFEDLSEPEVTFAGYVPDVTPYFDRARVFVAPLRFGAGMKGKVGMAMTLGLPVVTTSVGAEGMGLVDGVHALVADRPEEFAAAILLLQKDDELWASLSSNARMLVEERWSPDVMRDRLEDLVAMAVPRVKLRRRTWGLASPTRALTVIPMVPSQGA